MTLNMPTKKMSWRGLGYEVTVVIVDGAGGPKLDCGASSVRLFDEGSRAMDVRESGRGHGVAGAVAAPVLPPRAEELLKKRSPICSRCTHVVAVHRVSVSCSRCGCPGLSLINENSHCPEGLW